MDAGLHIGIAAWIHAQGDARGFAAWLPLPVRMTLVDLDVATSMSDVVRAWEFAQLANGAVREGMPVDSSAAPLWARHHAVLTAMDHASRAWDAAEQAELERALAVLFEPGPFPVQTPAYLLYEEYATAHRDLEQSQASAADIAAVLALWVVAGRKTEIEAAQATISRLMQRSSRPVAETERIMLHPDLLLSTPSGNYAPTTMTPLSATDETTWLHGEATVDELDRCVGDSPARAQWEAWRANRHGSIRFRFVALTLHRSWFTPSLYERRDWRLADGEVAAAGDGIGGPVPAFADRMYLAAVEGTQLRGDDPVPRPQEPPDGRPVGTVVLHDAVLRPAAHLSRPVRGGMKGLNLARVAPLRPAALPAPAAVTALRPELAVATARPPVVPGPIVLTEPAMRPAVLGRLELVPLARLHARFALAERLIVHAPEAPAPVAAAPAFVVGLGCRALPAAPNPDDRYQWAA